MSIAFITLTNTGYIDYTLNCLTSLQRVKSDLTLHSYCIGKEGYDILTAKGHTATLIDDNTNSNFQIYRTGNWSNIVYNKFCIIHNNLQKYDYVCITDGDIVFENKDFFSYLLATCEGNDLLIQNETMKNTDTTHVCSGFMFIKSTPITIELFDPKHVEQYKNTVGWGDQAYINKIKDKLTFKPLPLELFPNGQYYYANAARITPYLIHFNWVKGHEKQQRMKEYNKWYIGPAHYNTHIQISLSVINDVFKNIKKDSKMLVFGLGYDSKMWYEGCNRSVFFVENKEEYIKLNIKDIPQDNIIKYNYKTTVMTSESLSNDAIREFTVPEKLVKEAPFDIIIIDGPEGYSPSTPGRLIPCYWSQFLSKPGTLLYIDDSKRHLENFCIQKYFNAYEKHQFTDRGGCTKICVS
jgi:hypothetical protein